MSCETSEANLKRRQAYAIRKNWGWVPEFEQFDAECPYCGVDLAIEYDYEGADETEDECPACGKVFDLYIEWEPVYTCKAKKGETDDEKR